MKVDTKTAMKTASSSPTAMKAASSPPKKISAGKGNAVMKKPASNQIVLAKRPRDDDGSDDSSDSEKDLELRDRIKARKFRSIWNTLEPSTRVAYSEAKGSGRGDSRELCSKIVNSTVERTDGGKLVINENNPILKEIKQRYTDKYMDDKQGGAHDNNIVNTYTAHLYIHI